MWERLLIRNGGAYGDMARHSLQVNVRALVDLLSSNLYSNPRVAIRELIANARDSLLKRLAGEAPGDGEIHFDVDFSRRSLVVRDNGIGMDAAEIEQALSTIADSSTRLLQQQAPPHAPWVHTLAGYFGLGFFSVFMVSEEVEVRTQRDEPGARAYLWHCSDLACATYELRETDLGPHGTTVRLRIRPEFDDLLYPPLLTQYITRYADLVEFPILVSGQTGPVNRMQAPWEADGFSEDELRQLLIDRGLVGKDPPLCLMPLPDIPGLRGCLFLPARPEQARGVELHVRRLFVAESAKFAPGSLPFLRGVIQCDWVPLTLSREDVVAGDELEALRICLQNAFLDGLRDLEKRRPVEFAKVLNVYERHLKTAAVEDEAVLDAIGEAFRFPVGAGQSVMRLGEFLRLKPDKPIYYLSDPQRQGHYVSLLADRGVPVVVVGDRLDEVLLKRLAQLRKREAVRADRAEVGNAVEAPSRWLEVEALFSALEPQLATKTVTFQVPIPAILSPPSSAEAERTLRELRQRPDVQSQRMAELLEMALAQGPRERERLLLNATHPLVQALREACEARTDHEVLLTVAAALLAAVRLYSQPTDAGERLMHYNALADACRVLLKRLRSTATELERHAPGPLAYNKEVHNGQQ